MRSFHRNLSFLAALALAGVACGGDGGTPPTNDPPVADFSFTCNALACTFTNESTDPDGAADITTYAWNFGGDGTSAELSPAHTFSAAGPYDVALTVTDAGGESNTSTQTVTVSTTPTNTNPTAQFSFDCLSLACGFTDESSDPDAGDAVASWAWDFGDGATATVQNPSHSYTVTVPDTFTVTLIAADNQGAADTTSNDVIVAPPASCTGASCDLTLQADAMVKVTLDSIGCTADGNTLRITAPVDTTLFADGCNTLVGTTYDLVGPAGSVFTSGTTIVPEVTSGSQDLAFPPTLRLRAGSVYPTWILEFDDGEGCGAADPDCGGREPDFDDLIIKIEATP